MGRVIVMNRQQAEETACNMGGPIISIRGSFPKNDRPNLKADFWRDVLSLRFDDTTLPEFDLILFGEREANHIRRFIAKHELEENIYVHCQAGMSRSVAVGMWISEIQNRVLVLKAVHSTEYYNRHVYKTLAAKDRFNDIVEAFKGL